jgi:hypothetical protein
LDEDVGVFGCHVTFVGCLYVGHGDDLTVLECLFVIIRYLRPDSNDIVGPV